MKGSISVWFSMGRHIRATIVLSVLPNKESFFLVVPSIFSLVVSHVFSEKVVKDFMFNVFFLSKKTNA